MLSYPENIKYIMKRLKAAGYRGYAVGGALRDLLLGREVHDWDVTTAAPPARLVEIFADERTYDAGLKHGTLSVVLNGEVVEITTFRIDGDYRDSRHPESVRFTDRIADDLARRDFTVNAMAYNDEVGLVDLYGGREDLQERILRAVGEPKRRFTEDALRILRGFRFASVLCFEIEEKTLAAMRECRAGLAVISAERIAAELRGLLLGGDASRVLVLMRECGVLEIILPDAMPGDALSDLSLDFELRMAYLLRMLSPEGAGARARALKLSNASVSKITRLVRSLNIDIARCDEHDIRRLMSQYGELFDLVLHLQKALGTDVSAAWEFADQSRARGDCLSMSELAVNGSDLMEIGIKGRKIGEVINALFELVMRTPEKNQKAFLMKEAERIIKKTE